MTTQLPLTSAEFAEKYRRLGCWKDQTIAERVLAMADEFPEKNAIVIGEKKITYKEFRALAENIASNMLDLGLKAGDVVAGQLPNSAEGALLHIACNMIGLLYIPLHDSWREVEVAHMLAIAKIKLLVCPATYRGFDHLQMINQLRPKLPELVHVFTLAEAGRGSRIFDELLTAATRTREELARFSPDPDLPGAVMLSGGTTSLSKISRFSSNDMLAMLDNEAERARFSCNDISAAIAPAGTGATGYIYPILMTLVYGATSVILERWGDPAEAVDLIVRHNCTYGTAIPTQLIKMVPVLEQTPVERFKNFRCFLNAGAPLPYETAAKVELLMECAIQSVYGATDGGTPTMIDIGDPKEKRLSTVGRVVKGCECQIWDEEGRPVAVGKPGEVVWRSADKSWGYLGDDEQTAKVFTEDHFYKSGDLGVMDEDGYLKIVGRIKDMILRGGRNISPRLIEEALMKHPSVQEVAVAAMPDPVLGERACAFVQLRENKTLSLAQVVEFLMAEGLAKFQLPERLEIMEELPKSTGAKVAKGKLTAFVTEKLQQEAQ